MTVAPQLSAVRGGLRDALPGLSDVLRRAVDLTGRVAVSDHLPVGPEWETLEDLGGDRFVVHLDRACERHGGCSGSVARAAAANLLVGDVASTLVVPLVSALVEQRRVILPDPAGVALRFDRTGAPVAYALAGARLAVLPEDVLAGVVGVVVAPDLSALRALAASAVAEMMEPLVRTAASTVRRGRRAFWSETAERLGAAVLLVERTLGRPGSAPAEAQALLDAAPRLLARTLDWVDVPVAPAVTVPWKRRGVCCLAYQTPEQAASFCSACPKISCAETVTEMTTWLAANPHP